MIKTTMYFGRRIGSDEVTHGNWIGFLSQVVDKYFDGYTWFNGYGIWKEKSEESFILEILHQKARDNASKVVAIAEEYKNLYTQDTVLVTIQELNVVMM